MHALHVCVTLFSYTRHMDASLAMPQWLRTCTLLGLAAMAWQPSVPQRCKLGCCRRGMLPPTAHELAGRLEGVSAQGLCAATGGANHLRAPAPAVHCRFLAGVLSLPEYRFDARQAIRLDYASYVLE